MLGVSVRTVHNIEYSRKRANRELLEKLASALNYFAARQPHLPPLMLTADHFIDHPESIASVFLQSIMLNDCSQLFVGENPLASAEFRWLAPGRDVSIPFAGEYCRWETQILLQRLHHTVDHVGLEDIQIVEDLTNQHVCVQSTSIFKHPESQQIYRFRAAVDIDFSNRRLGLIRSKYDAERLAEFLRSGTPPKMRKSGAELG